MRFKIGCLKLDDLKKNRIAAFCRTMNYPIHYKNFCFYHLFLKEMQDESGYNFANIKSFACRKSIKCNYKYLYLQKINKNEVKQFQSRTKIPAIQL